MRKRLSFVFDVAVFMDGAFTLSELQLWTPEASAVPLPFRWGAPNVGRPYRVGASGAGGDRIPLMQNKGERSLLTTLQG